MRWSNRRAERGFSEARFASLARGRAGPCRLRRRRRRRGAAASAGGRGQRQDERKKVEKTLRDFAWAVFSGDDGTRSYVAAERPDFNEGDGGGRNPRGPDSARSNDEVLDRLRRSRFIAEAKQPSRGAEGTAGAIDVQSERCRGIGRRAVVVSLLHWRRARRSRLVNAGAADEKRNGADASGEPNHGLCRRHSRAGRKGRFRDPAVVDALRSGDARSADRAGAAGRGGRTRRPSPRQVSRSPSSSWRRLWRWRR